MKKQELGFVMALSLGLAFTGCQDGEKAAPKPQEKVSGEIGRKVPETLYQCPMHPQIVRKSPGTCPLCGMNLAPVAMDPGRDSGASAESMVAAAEEFPPVRIAPSKLKAIGLRTEAAVMRDLNVELRVDGSLALDPARVQTVTLKSSGYLEWVTGKLPGQAVKQGEILARIYSPEWVASQGEWLQALRQSRAWKAGRGEAGMPGFSDSLALSARRRLLNQGLPEKTLQAIEESGEVQRSIPVPSPMAGAMLERSAETGQAVSAGQALFRIADLQSLYAAGQVPQSRWTEMRLGLKAEVEVPSLGNRRFPGEIASLAPTLDGETRTGEIRIAVKNNLGIPLRPAMLVIAHIRLERASGNRVLAVPEQAVLHSGLRNLVIVQARPGEFQPREIAIGLVSEGWAEVTSGLREGEIVVTTSQFLIDSESNLRSAIQAMSEPTGEAR